MKMRKLFIFVKKNLKINMLKMKDIIQLGTTVITYCISSNKRPYQILKLLSAALIRGRH